MSNVEVKLLPPISEVEGGFRSREKTDTNIKKRLNQVPQNQVAFIYQQFGLLEGLIQRMSMAPFEGEFSLEIQPGRVRFTGEMRTYARQLASNLLHQLNEIEGLANAISHGYEGDFSWTMTFSQTSEIVDIRAVS